MAVAENHLRYDCDRSQSTATRASPPFSYFSLNGLNFDKRFSVFIDSADFPTDFHEHWPPVTQILRRSCRRFSENRKQLLLNRFPILKWLPSYKLQYLFHDFIAGLTVGLTAIPQGIAYAIVAGLPPQYGLYSGFVGCFVYFLLGSCKDVTIGKYVYRSILTANVQLA